MVPQLCLTKHYNLQRSSMGLLSHELVWGGDGNCYHLCTKVDAAVLTSAFPENLQFPSTNIASYTAIWWVEQGTDLDASHPAPSG